MKKLIIYLMVLVFLVTPGINIFAEEEYRINELSDNQIIYFIKENKIANISFGIQCIGLMAIGIPDLMEYRLNDSRSRAIETVGIGTAGLFLIGNALLSKNKMVGDLGYNEKKGFVLIRRLDRDTKLKYAGTELLCGLVVIAMPKLLEAYINIFISSFGGEPFHGDIPPELFVCAGIMGIGALIQFMDAGTDVPSKENNSTSQDKLTSNSTRLLIDFRNDYTVIRLARMF